MEENQEYQDDLEELLREIEHCSLFTKSSAREYGIALIALKYKMTLEQVTEDFSEYCSQYH